MPDLKKMFKNIKSEHVLGIVGLIILVFAFYKYSEGKNIFKMGMTQGKAPLNSAPINNPTKIIGSSSSTTTYAPYNGATTSSVSNSSSSANAINKPASNPADLLPSNNASSNWSAAGPPNNDLKGINLLNPSQITGINTQGSSLRNSNLQVRSEPANPRTNTNCPWNISTIETDTFRKPLEIGAGA
mgnify:FL=1|tara:strand:+ start:179 stop:736 length:558 start_codon:yes stop_codon:yes gene_type:complete